MIPGPAIDALFAMFSAEGLDLGDKRLRFDGDEITIRLKREGDVIYVTATPAVRAKKDGGIWSWRITRGLAEAVIGTAKVVRDRVTVYVQSDIIGTFEETIEVGR